MRGTAYKYTIRITSAWRTWTSILCYAISWWNYQHPERIEFEYILMISLLNQRNEDIGKRNCFSRKKNMKIISRRYSRHENLPLPPSNTENHDDCMGLLPDTYSCALRMRWECQERFSRHRLQRKPLVSDPGMHHGTCVTYVPCCMSGSLTRGGGESVPGIPGTWAIRNFTYLIRDPWHVNVLAGPLWGETTAMNYLRENHRSNSLLTYFRQQIINGSTSLNRVCHLIIFVNNLSQIFHYPRQRSVFRVIWVLKMWYQHVSEEAFMCHAVILYNIGYMKYIHAWLSGETILITWASEKLQDMQIKFDVVVQKHMFKS